MHRSLFWRAVAPHALLLFPCVLLAVADLPPFLSWLNGLASVALLPTIVLSYGLSDFLTTHLEKPLIDFSALVRLWNGREGDGMSEGPTVVQWMILASPLIFLFLMCAGANVVASVCAHWTVTVLYLMSVDLLVLAALIIVRGGGKTFEEVVWPRIVAARDEAVRGARAKAREFYDLHRDLLERTHPPSLFHSTLNAQVSDGCANAWGAASALIGQLRGVVEEEARRKKAEERARQKRERDVRRIDRQVEELRAKIENERAAAALTGDDSNEDEIESLEAKIRQQEAQKEDILATGDET